MSTKQRLEDDAAVGAGGGVQHPSGRTTRHGLAAAGSDGTFTRHRAGSLLKMLGTKPGEQTAEEEQLEHHLKKKGQYFQPKSLCCLALDNPIRQQCIRVVRNPWFDRIVVLAILLNCIVLSFNDPLDKDNLYWRNKFVEKSDIWFTIAFTIEMVLKIIAMGFIGKGSYLADRWNWLDFIVVVIGYVSKLPKVDNLSALRTFRVLRPLRTLSAIPQMAVIVKSMLASIPALFNVFLLCVFIFFIFGIIGLQLWTGALRGRCAFTNPDTGLVESTDVFCALECTPEVPCAGNFGDDCSPHQYLYLNATANELQAIMLPTSCMEFENPRRGLVGFDNIGMACLTIFTSITLEGWVDVMYALNHTWGLAPVTAIYFILLIMFGSFFLLNLALAVIWDEYVKASEAMEEKQQIDELAAENTRRLKREAEASEAAAAAAAASAGAGAGAATVKTADAGAGGPDDGAGGPPDPDVAAGAGGAGGAGSGSGSGSGAAGGGAGSTAHDDDLLIAAGVMGEGGEGGGSGSGSGSGDGSKESTTRSGPPDTLFGGCCYSDARHGCLYYFVESKAFNIFIVVLILLNTLCLALEHHDMHPDFESVLGILNYVFTGAFFVEMVLKLIGLGLCGYLSSSWNTFDGFIVIVSLVEITLVLLKIDSLGGGLSALRTFRLMRVLRLAKTWKDLRNLLATIIESVKEVANASVVLLIVMFIFCLLGMQLFGGKMDGSLFASGEQPRAHFDNLWWSFVTVFQVLTGENWNEVLYDTVEATGEIAIIYFTLLNIVGNYLILNLFLAILLGNFDSAEDDEDEGDKKGDKKGDKDKKKKKDKDGASTPSAKQAAAGGRVVSADVASSKQQGDAGLTVDTSAVGAASAVDSNDVMENPVAAAGAGGVEPPYEDGATGALAVAGAGSDADARKQSLLLTEALPSTTPSGADGASASATAASAAASGSASSAAVVAGGASARYRPGSGSGSESKQPDDGSDAGTGLLVVVDRPGAGGAGADAGAGDPNAAAARTAVSKEVWKGEGGEGGKGGSGGGGSESSPLATRTFFLLPRTNVLRIAFARVTKHKFFDPFILILIAVSTVLLAMDEPRIAECKLLPKTDPDNCVVFASFLQTADLIITILFVIEMVLKIVSMGFWYGPNDYLRSPWNVLDFAIVIVSLLSLALGDATQLRALRSLRALRALRPLRVVSRYPGLRLVVNSIFGALPKVSNVMLVNLLFFLIFGIVGVQNWMGALALCNDPDPAYNSRAACKGTFVLQGPTLCGMLPTEPQIEACLRTNSTTFERRWESVPANFDHTGNALLTVFEVASGEMWPNIMYHAVDATGADQGMVRDTSPLAAMYFILINIVCAFFMLEIFTGVVIDNFNKMKEASEGSALLTDEQQMWVDTMKMMLSTAPRRRMKPPIRGKCWRRPIFSVANHKWFEIFIMVLIGLNTIIMALRHYDQGPTWDAALDIANYVFAGLFAVEAAVKLLAFGWCQYFSVGWNRFDFFLVIASFVGELIDLGQLATLLRIVRVARIFRLIRVSRGLQVMFKTLVFSFPQLVNVGTVLLLLFFIYAIVGMNLFADIKLGDHLNEDANFRSFFRSMITLFRMSTGESYNGLMHDCMIQEPYCDPAINCGFPGFAPVYFVSFYVLSAFILLNILVAIILDNFGDTVALDEGRSGNVLNDQNMEAFQAVWSQFDPSASKFIPASKMVNVLLELQYPLGLRDAPGNETDTSLRKQAKDVITAMNIPQHGNQVFFHEVLSALAARACGDIQIDAPVPILSDLQNKQNRIMKSVAKSQTHSVTEHMAAERVQSAFKGHRLRRISQTTPTSAAKAAAAVAGGASGGGAGAGVGAARRGSGSTAGGKGGSRRGSGIGGGAASASVSPAAGAKGGVGGGSAGGAQKKKQGGGGTSGGSSSMQGGTVVGASSMTADATTVEPIDPRLHQITPTTASQRRGVGASSTGSLSESEVSEAQVRPSPHVAAATPSTVLEGAPSATASLNGDSPGSDRQVTPIGVPLPSSDRDHDD